jgi:hypothetical protein
MMWQAGGVGQRIAAQVENGTDAVVASDRDLIGAIQVELTESTK